MKIMSPLVQLTLALVLLTLTLLIMANLFLGVLPARADEQQRVREQLSEAIAVQIAALLGGEDRAALDSTLRSVVQRVEGLRSLGVRRDDGRLVAESGGHDRLWPVGEAVDGSRFTVALSADGRRWGTVELAYVVDDRPAWRRWLDEPIVRLGGFFALAGAFAFALYMRRALQHLDPASVIPDRVQRAFDAMTEGVAVLDARGRVLLVNRAFRGLHPEADQVRSGQPLSSIPWLGAGLSEDPASHPWARAMHERSTTSGASIEVGHDVERPRRLIVNCAPITDAGGAVRGCLATFDDTTELHKANLALQQANAELSAAQAEVERKNAELHRLATRDPLSGCLNRRALYEVLNPMFEAALRDGTPLGCLMIDIDHFKSINDTHGHAIGDRVIQETARRLADTTRAGDLVCRYGGEEFCVIVPGLCEADLLALAERVRARIEADCGRSVREVDGLRVTASLGCEMLGADVANAQSMIDRADQALYTAKRTGRNRVAKFTA